VFVAVGGTGVFVGVGVSVGGNGVAVGGTGVFVGVGVSVGGNGVAVGGTGVFVGVGVSVGGDDDTHASLPESVKVCPAIGMNSQS
jgi:hypothetical protein